MPVDGEPSCGVLTPPLQPAGRLPVSVVAGLVAIDALVRASSPRPSWRTATLGGDLRSQYEAERELARDGTDRALVSDAELGERVAAVEAAGRERLTRLITSLAIGVEVDASPFGGTAGEDAAVCAFVRLYDRGLLAPGAALVDVCTRCRTVVGAADAEPAEVEVERLVVQWSGAPGFVGAGGDSRVEVVMTAPETLPGAVAIAVPPGHPAAGLRVDVPLAGGVLPVLASPSVGAPTVVVPAHDRVGRSVAEALGLSGETVLDEEGTLRRTGPLDGLGRFAARVAARDALGAEGALLDAQPATEIVLRCGACGTVLLTRPANCWSLRRPGALAEPWCLSSSVVLGRPIPAWSCEGCGRDVVSSLAADGCPSCAGPLAPAPGVLDPRFVAAVWPLAARAPQERCTVVDPAPGAALGVARVLWSALCTDDAPAVLDGIGGALDNPGAGETVDPEDIVAVATDDAAAARAALLLGWRGPDRVTALAAEPGERDRLLAEVGRRLVDVASPVWPATLPDRDRFPVGALLGRAP